MEDYSLTPGEVAVLVNHMTGGRFLRGSTSIPELGLNEQGMREVEEGLLDRGLLLAVPFEEAAGVTSELASVLSAALTPERVCIVRKVHGDHTDPVVFYSITPERITRNTVDARGQHIFARLNDLEEAVSEILAAEEGGVSPTAPTRKATSKKVEAKSQLRPLMEVLIEAQRLVMLLVVADPAEEAAAVTGLTWLEAKEGSWVVDAAAPEESPQAAPVSAAELRQRVRDLVGTATEPETTRRGT